MCGIHLIFSAQQKHTQQLDQMIKQSSHRGPDNYGSVYGCLNNNYYALGHNLLAILTTENEPQPIKDQNYILSFNGEVYNYLNLISKYGLDLPPYSSDTEVVFELLKKFGKSIISEFNGMFALVFLSKKDNQILLARDFFGQKPLYYASSASNFVASSENKAMLATSLVSDNLSTAQVRNILFQKHVASGYSIYQEISQVKPGQLIEVSSDFIVNKSFFTPKPNQKKTLADDLNVAIALHTAKINSPAVFYSGGLDSSIILHQLKRNGFKPTAYTINTSNVSRFSTSDLSYAKGFTKALQISHEIIQPEPHCFSDFIQHIDIPIGDGAFYFNWLLSKTVSKTHKVALTGNGADELFGGYKRHGAFLKYQKNKSLMLLIAKFRGFLKVNHKNNTFRLLHRFLSSVSKNEQQTFINFLALDLGISHESIYANSFSLKEALQFDSLNYLPQDILSLSDQAGMSHSLELRSPFLDNNIWQSSEMLNSEIKVNNGGKHHLKSIYEKHTCFKPIISRGKQGFGIPFLSFFGADQLKMIRARLSVLHHFLSNSERRSIETMLLAKKDSYSNEYWTLLILTEWLNRVRGLV